MSGSPLEAPSRNCAECGEPIHEVDGLWRHVNVNRVCKDGLSQRQEDAS